MGMLRFPQWELYARALVEIELQASDPAVAANRGELRHQAYKKAGYDGNLDNARRLANKREIKARVSELFSEALEYQDVNIVKVVTRIDRIGRADIADLLEAGGKHFKDITKLPKELTAAIESVEIQDGKVKVKLCDKLGANTTLLKHFGGMPSEHPQGDTTNINNFLSLLSVDDQRTLAAALKALPAGPTVDSGPAGKEHSAA
jgi:hypothetical protein